MDSTKFRQEECPHLWSSMGPTTVCKGECLRWNLNSPAWTQPCSTDSPAWTEPPSFPEGGVSPLIVQHGLSHIPPGEGVPTDSPAWTQPYSAKGSILADSPAWTQPYSEKGSILADSPAWTQPYSARGSILADSPAWTQPTSPKWGEGVSLLIVQHGLSHIPPRESVPSDGRQGLDSILPRGVSSLIVQHGHNHILSRGCVHRDI